MANELEQTNKTKANASSIKASIKKSDVLDTDKWLLITSKTNTYANGVRANILVRMGTTGTMSSLSIKGRSHQSGGAPAFYGEVLYTAYGTPQINGARHFVYDGGTYFAIHFNPDAFPAEASQTLDIRYVEHEYPATEFVWIDESDISHMGNLNMLPLKGGITFFSPYIKNWLYPFEDGSVNIGSSSLRFKDIYITNSPIVSSDMFEKTNIRSLDADIAIHLIKALDPVEYLRYGDSKKHYGFLAQQLEYALSKCGIDPSTFAGLAIDDDASLVESGGYEERFVTDENGIEQKVSVPIMKSATKGEIYGIRYEELIAPLIAVVQDLYKKSTVLEERITAVENAMIEKYD